ncbi:hypothetical protein EHZ19_29855 [Paraburkholderia bannensis]|nr:hypothetical protein EHZ19_29855 [Paraburkholderia bannensis]
MKSSAHGRRPGSRNYTKEFREAVVAEANDPNRSIAEVARTHGLNANMVAQWRRRSLDVQRASAAPCVALLPVDVIERMRSTSDAPQSEAAEGVVGELVPISGDRPACAKAATRRSHQPTSLEADAGTAT